MTGAGLPVLMHWQVVDPDGNPLVHVVTDRAAGELRVTVTDRPALRLGPVHARALGMALAEATYVGLEPSGPWLRVLRTDLRAAP